MRKTMLLVLMCLTLSAADSPKTLPMDAPIKTELDKVFGQLSDQMKHADALVKRLGEVVKRKPEELAAEVRASASALSALVDRLQGDGDMALNIQAIRNAANIHHKRVQDMPKGSIEEEDRTKVMSSWKDIVKGADNAQASMEAMRGSLLSALNRLRMRSTAIGEMMLVKIYAEDAKAKTLADKLHATYGMNLAISPVPVEARMSSVLPVSPDALSYMPPPSPEVTSPASAPQEAPAPELSAAPEMSSEKL